MGKLKDSHTYGTLGYFKRVTWFNIRSRTVNSGKKINNNIAYLEKQITLEISKAEYYNWIDENSEIILNMYNKNITPSIGRINHELSYTLSNIKIETRSENASESRKRNNDKVILAANKAKFKKIILIHPNGICEKFESLKSAALKYNLNADSISAVLRGTKKTHKKFKAIYAKE